MTAPNAVADGTLTDPRTYVQQIHANLLGTLHPKRDLIELAGQLEWKADQLKSLTGLGSGVLIGAAKKARMIKVGKADRAATEAHTQKSRIDDMIARLKKWEPSDQHCVLRRVAIDALNEVGSDRELVVVVDQTPEEWRHDEMLRLLVDIAAVTAELTEKVEDNIKRYAQIDAIDKELDRAFPEES